MVTAALPVFIGAPASAQGKPLITSEQARPPAELLTDCKTAPAGAITRVPRELAGWATIYCSRIGQIFSPNDRHLAFFPGTGKRGAINAAEFSGRQGPGAATAHFTEISYAALSKGAVEPLIAVADEATASQIRGKRLFRLDLTIDTGQTVSMIVADPVNDPFWVFPLAKDKLGRAAFYVVSLDFLNRNR